MMELFNFLSLINLNCLLLKHFFISILFLQMKFSFFSSVCYFCQICFVLFGRKLINYLSVIYWNSFLQKHFFILILFLQIKFLFCCSILCSISSFQKYLCRHLYQRTIKWYTEIDSSRTFLHLKVIFEEAVPFFWHLILLAILL